MSAEAAAAAAAIIAQATKASGVIVRVEPDAFLTLVALNDEPLIVHDEGGFFSPSHKYLTSYRGLAFFTKSQSKLDLPHTCQIVKAKKIWIPG